MEDKKLLQLNNKRKGRQIWHRVLSVLMCITVFITTYALILPAVTLDATEPTLTTINWGGIEWDDSTQKFSGISLKLDTQQDTTYTLQYSDNGVNWNAVSGITYNSQKPGKQDNYMLVPNSTTLDELFQNSSLTRKYRFLCQGKKTSSSTISYDFVDILDVVKPHFKEWLAEDYAGPALTDKDAYIAAFHTYYNVPTATVSAGTQANVGDTVFASVAMSGPTSPATEDFKYLWQYYNETTKEWTNLDGDTPTTNASYEVDPADSGLIPYGGARVRCKVYAMNGDFVTRSNETLLNPQQKLFNDTHGTIETKLVLNSVYSTKNTFNLTYNSTQWNWMYFDAVAADPNVPFYDKESLWNFLCKTYLQAKDKAIEEGETLAEAEDLATAELQKVWRYYLYDILDPCAQNTNYGTYYACEGGFGDPNLTWAKTNDSDASFHYKPVSNPTEDKDKMILKLNYDYLDGGVDYDSFIKDMSKYATADAAGDGNSDRKYNINMTTDASAKVKAPIVMLFQVQTSWQLFDLEHANALKGQGGTEVGTVANTTELATLYDIKHALLDFIKYLDNKYPGNNLVLGVMEVRHGGSDSMFNTMFTTENGSSAALYVSNNPDVLYDAVSQWDIFGNCEHVHYDNNTISAAVKNLGIDLSDFKDKNNKKISYDDIRKTVVVIGGGTENNDDKNGYGCVLPWDDFKTAGIDSVYGVRVNEGTSYAGNTANGTPILSWIDHDDNNGTPYVEGVGSGFTQKYVCTNRELLYNTFVEISEKEFAIGGVDIYDVNQFVENVVMTDTVRNEFELDYTKPFKISMTPDLNGNRNFDVVVDLKNLSLKNASGTSIGSVTKEVSGNAETYTLSYTTMPTGENPPYPTQLVITKNSDGTTKVEVKCNRIYNTQKVVVDFGVQAKEGYIGSNNVFTNINVPTTTYTHTLLNTDIVKDYTVKCRDNPQVNVPIEYSTENGDHKILYRSPEINDGKVIRDISLNNASVIVAEIQNKVDDFGQINGTLEYKWILPEGSTPPEYECGSVAVVNGKVQGDFPDISHNYTFMEDGRFIGRLEVTFTPEAVNPKGEFHDVKTRTEVSEQKRVGAVTFEVLSPETKLTLSVKKIWKGTPTVDQIKFKLVYKDSEGVERFYQEGGEDREFVLSDPAWETTFNDIEPIPDEYGSVVEFTAVEAEVDGYSSEVQFEIEKTYNYEASIQVNFTAQYGNNGNQVIIHYLYNGEEHSKVFDAGSTTISPNIKWDAMLAENLQTKTDGTPFNAVITKVEYINSSNKVYTVFKNDIDPYDCEITAVGNPVYRLKSTAKITKGSNNVISYKVNGESKSFAFKPTKDIPANTPFTVTLPDYVNSLSSITNITLPNGNWSQVPGDGYPYIGMRKQHISFTAPFTLAKDKTVRVTLTEVVEAGGTPNVYIGEYKIPNGGFAQDSRVEFDFPDILPDGEYYISDLKYVDGDNETSMTEKTKVSFTTPIALTGGKKVRVTIGNSDNSYTQTVEYTLPSAVAEGGTVVVEFPNNPPAGTAVTVKSILYDNADLKSITTLKITTPIALKNKFIGVKIKNESGTVKQFYFEAKGDYKAGSVLTIPEKISNVKQTLDAWFASADGFGSGYDNPSHSYTVTEVTYGADAGHAFDTPLATNGSVTFTVPPKADGTTYNAKNKNITLTATYGGTTKTVTGKLDGKDHKTGSSVSVTLDGPIPTDLDYTYTLSIDEGAGLNVPEFTYLAGGTLADAFLKIGGESPVAGLSLGGALPDNKVTSTGFNTISASMIITEGITVENVAHTVNYVNTETGATGSFTATPVVNGTTATFTNNNTIPAGEYEIVSITRTVNSEQMPYYNDLSGYLKTESQLQSVTAQSACDITNTPNVVMPSTGGLGIPFYVITGFCMMAGSIIYGFVLRRKRERGQVN